MKFSDALMRGLTLYMALLAFLIVLGFGLGERRGRQISQERYAALQKSSQKTGFSVKPLPNSVLCSKIESNRNHLRIVKGGK